MSIEWKKGSILAGDAGKKLKKKMPFEHILKLFWYWEMNKERDNECRWFTVNGKYFSLARVIYMNESSEKYFLTVER